MKKIATIFAATALLALLAGSAFAANAVRISQVYGGGGGTTVNTDYVELFNSSSVPVDISGWAVEYGSATGLWNSFAGNAFVFPAGATIQPCSYLLLACAKGTGIGGLVIAADYRTATTVFNMSGTAGKVLLVTQLNDNLGPPAPVTPGIVCGTEVGTIMDRVAWGATNVNALCFEIAPAPGTTAATATFRANGGLTDTDNNSLDFATGVPAPRTSTAPVNPGCLVVPTVRGTWGQLKSIYR